MPLGMPVGSIHAAAPQIMGPGEILFQDDVKNSPAKKTPTHQSGVVGDFPCQVSP